MEIIVDCGGRGNGEVLFLYSLLNNGRVYTIPCVAEGEFILFFKLLNINIIIIVFVIVVFTLYFNHEGVM